MALIRLDRLLSSRGYCTRSAARGFLREFEVLANGVRATKEDQKVDDALVTIDGERVDVARIVAMIHKPVGVICSHDDEEGELIYDLLPERWQQRNPQITTAGRLDKETSGLLIVTDDGQLVHKFTSPKRHLEKVYHATLGYDLRGNEVELFASGELKLEGDPKPCLPARLEVITPTEVRLTITEGRYHQVRRMFGAVFNRVVTLHRERVGDLTLGELKPGEWKLIDL